jgi:predicted nucleic-acid-binding protein
MILEDKIFRSVLAYVRSEKYGKLFTKDEIVFNLCKRHPFFSEQEKIYDVIDLLLEEKYLILDEGLIRSNTLLETLKNWIDYR